MSNKISELKEIMALLRDPVKGCPWDIKQNFSSIAPCTIEEAYEVLDAIEQNDMVSLKEELGDLLLQVIFHSQMASEQGLFNLDDVISAIINKLISRHPHVFGNHKISTAKEQEIAWEKHKEKERQEKNQQEKHVSILDGITKALPANQRALKLQKKAAKIGFDWPNMEGVFAKITEEINELHQAINTNHEIKEELGDVLFSVINLARRLEIDPEEALRLCNAKFEKRFRYMEEKMSKLGLNLKDVNLAEMDKLWEEAKINA